jgi:hypothetical protein
LFNSGIIPRMEDIAYGHKRFVLVGERAIYSSEDGTNWTSRATPAGDFTCVSFIKGYFFAGASTNMIMVSEDGIQWQTMRPGVSSPLTEFAFFGGRVIASCWNAQLIQSEILLPRLSVQPTRTPYLGLNVTVHGQTGKVYPLEYSLELEQWKPLRKITNTAPATTVFEPISPHISYHLFYRVKREP